MSEHARPGFPPERSPVPRPEGERIHTIVRAVYQLQTPKITCSPAHLLTCSPAHLLTCSPAHLHPPANFVKKHEKSATFNTGAAVLPSQFAYASPAANFVRKHV